MEAKKGKLITLSTDMAIKFGIADAEKENIDEILDYIDLSGAEIKNSKEIGHGCK